MSHLDLVKIIAGLISDLIEARESIAGWAAYASDHFQEKHDLVGELNHFSKKISEAEACLEQLKKQSPKKGDFLSR